MDFFSVRDFLKPEEGSICGVFCLKLVFMDVIWNANELFFRHPDIYGFSFDSRDIRTGDAFLAINGRFFDGHDFILQALEKGASCAIIDEAEFGKRPELAGVEDRLIIVKSVMKTLVEIAAFRRSKLTGKVFAITGSLGKTSSKENLARCFESNGFKTFKSQKNFNTILGVSIDLAIAPLDADFYVMEVGINEFGEMDEIAGLIRPDYCIISHIAAMHIEELKSLKNILYEKSRIMDFTSNGAFFCGDLWYSKFLRAKALGLGLEISNFGYSTRADEMLKGLINSLCAKFDLKFEFEFVEVAGRKRIIQLKDGMQLIDSCYNAGLGSMAEGLDCLKRFSGRKIAILGDMKGLGARTRRYHEILSLFLAEVDYCFLVGEGMKHVRGENVFWFDSYERLLEAVVRYVEPGCVVLVKGSNSMKLGYFVEALERLFS
jgi:UDP-N-acetylmuramoyl-tripeptide--D-alanyl-D-alanine ligase